MDRFKRICRPYERTFSADKSRYISIAAILFSIGSCWPSLILYGTRKVDLGKAIGSACLLENKYDKTPYPILFFGYMVSTTFILFAIIIVLYYFVGLQIYKHRKFKLKNCTHVQKIIDEKSVTMKSEKSNTDKSKSSNTTQNNGKENTETKPENGCIVVNDATDVENEHNENELRPYQLGLSPPDPDPGTTCGLLEVRCQAEGISVCHEISTRNITFESRVTYEQSINEVKVEENENVPPKKPSPKRRKSKSRKKTRRVRYLLVRGASSLNASGVERCSNCLTVRIGRSTLMLFLITLVFVISFLPFYVIIIVRQSDITFVKRLSKGGLMVYHVFLRSYLLSSVVNPFIYSFCNAQFRDICKETFLKVILRRNPSFINRSKIMRRKH
jgi:ribosomal protein L32